MVEVAEVVLSEGSQTTERQDRSAQRNRTTKGETNTTDQTQKSMLKKSLLDKQAFYKMVEVAGVEPACLWLSQGASICILVIERILIYTRPTRQQN